MSHPTAEETSQPKPSNTAINIARVQCQSSCGDMSYAISPSAILHSVPHFKTEHKESEKMNKFLTGFKRFQKTYFRENTELYSRLAMGQQPKTLIVACCDSRVDPAIITDCDPGEVFTVRNVANLVPPYTPNEDNGGHHGVSAALEYAVNTLLVEDIIVLGHVACGGIAALMSDVKLGEFVQPWMSIARRAKENVLRKFSDCSPAIQARACERAAILVSLENLCSYPWIRDRLQAKTLTINGWYFDFEAGELFMYSPKTGGFEVLQSSQFNPMESGSGSFSPVSANVGIGIGKMGIASGPENQVSSDGHTKEAISAPSANERTQAAI